MKMPKFKLPEFNTVTILSLAATAITAGATILSGLAEDKKLDAKVTEKVQEVLANGK